MPSPVGQYPGLKHVHLNRLENCNPHCYKNPSQLHQTFPTNMGFGTFSEQLPVRALMFFQVNTS